MKTPRILLADDHPQVLSNLCRLADKVGDVVGAVHDGRAVIAEARRLHPDVIVLDITMPEVSGFEAARAIRREVPESKLVMCTVHTNPLVIDEAFAAGATGFIRKQSAHEDLASAIRAVCAGETFISPALRHREGQAGPAGPAADSPE